MTPAAFLALAATLCFAIALILTQYGLRTMPSWRSPLYSIGGSMIVAWMMAAIFVDPAGFNLKPALAQASMNLSIGAPGPAYYYEPVPAPRVGYVWAPGYWRWEHDRHVWYHGRWDHDRYYHHGWNHWHR